MTTREESAAQYVTTGSVAAANAKMVGGVESGVWLRGAPHAPAAPPKMALPRVEATEMATATGGKEWLRGPLSKTTGYRLLVSGEVGPREIGKLIKLLEAQKMVLEDDIAEACGEACAAEERERICTAIQAENDHCADFDYMLDSKDCISVARGTWVAPVAWEKTK